jgi:GNAT superfamily N-acetyltransferase
VATVSDVRGAEVDVRLLERPDLDAVVPALARAFFPDPLFGFFARSPRHEYDLLPAVFQAFCRDAVPAGEIWAAHAGLRTVGAAVWLPPGAMPRPTRREVALNLRAARVLAGARNRVAGFKLLDAVDKVHPTEPHWYLFLLGTDPSVQGRGVGGRLLAPVLERCDAEGLPAYLETQKESNLAFYGRHGFVLTEKLDVGGAPPIWTMTRPARG